MMASSHILLIEDNPGDALLIAAYLEEFDHSHELTTVAYLHEGLEALNTRAFDFIICDLNLPDCQGLETLSSLHENANVSDIPILILTGHTDEALAVQALKQGAQDYIFKDDLSSVLLARSMRHAYERFHYQKEAAQALRESELRFKRLTEASFEAIVVTEDDVIVDVNDPFCVLFGYDRNEVLRMKLTDFVTHDDSHILETALKTNNEHTLELSCQQKNQRIFIAEWRSKTLPHADKNVRVSAIRDINDQKQLEAKLQFEALHDPLTGLKNRSAFTEQLLQAHAYTKRYPDTSFAVMFIDLDRFKPINDHYGHSVGDQLLRLIAATLTESVRATDTVARLGGDEFILLLRNIDETNITNVAQNILNKLSQPFQVGALTLTVTASIGIVINDTALEHPEYLIRNADAAMYKAKEAGKNRYAIFDGALKHTTINNFTIESDLKQSFHAGNLTLFYQPLISLNNRQIIGFEALLRWPLPNGTMMPPDAFIPIAEENGLIIKLGKWVIKTACEQLQQWQKSYPNLKIHVNLSAKQLNDPTLIPWISDLIQQTHIKPKMLCLEITESVLLKSMHDALLVLEGLNKLGVQLHIDDFGTGYSSLAYLHRFPIHALKIDRNFIKQLQHDPQINQRHKSNEIVKTIISLSKSLHLNIIAEGIETTEQLELLMRLGCLEGQGFLFSEALPKDACTTLLREQMYLLESNKQLLN